MRTIAESDWRVAPVAIRLRYAEEARRMIAVPTDDPAGRFIIDQMFYGLSGLERAVNTISLAGDPRPLELLSEASEESVCSARRSVTERLKADGINPASGHDILIFCRILENIPALASHFKPQRTSERALFSFQTTA